MLIFLTEKNGEAPCAYFSYVLNFFEVQRVHVLIFHVLIKKSVLMLAALHYLNGLLQCHNFFFTKNVT